MASIQVMMCLSLFVLSHLIIAQPESTNLIRRGYSLQPNTNHSSWLSHSGLFAFGFYKQGNGHAVGIWLVSTNPDNMTVVWTANRDDPPVSSNSTIQFTKGGQLVLRSSQGQDTRNITNISDDQGVSALMLDSGNFVIYNNTYEVIWQSFSYPTNTILGGQNMTYYANLTSSLSTTNHSSGRFCLNILSGLVAYPVHHTDTKVPEEIYWEINTTNVGPIYMSEVSLDLTRAGILQLTKSELILQVVANIPYSSVMNETVIYRATLDDDGILRLYLHRFKIDGSSDVTIKWSALQNQCQVKGFCGFNSFCASNSTGVDCHCFPGFDYIDPGMRFMGCSRSFYDEEGCERKQPALFYNVTALENTKLGGLPYFLLSVNKEDCSKSCLEDCYCGAAYFVNGTCSKLKLPLMFGMKGENESGTVFIKWSSGNTRRMFPRHQQEQEQEHKRVAVESNDKRLIRILAASLGSITFLCLLIAIYSFLVYKLQVDKYRKLPGNSSLGLTEEFTLQSFSYNELEQATDGFKQELGRGSFGRVYKGSISKGQKIIAVKRLENLEEEEQRKFRTEMAIVRQTHHRNLVRLLGICMEGSRKLLVYEYMSKGSLADLLFNAERRLLWKERVGIALDVAKAILYLHEECEVQIIHCNIKPKNILVDDSGTAKISNFGFAILLMPNQTETISRVKVTKDYMTPEWQKNVFVTTKSDVYSFGIVLLEIICCRSNIEVNVETVEEVLLSTWVYKCFVTGELNKLVQEEEVDMKSLERMVKVGLLCVQDDQTLRPSMKSVILMLDGTMNVPLPPPPTTLVDA